MNNNLTERHFIRLEGIEVSAPIGYYPEERQLGVDFIISLEVVTDFSEAASHDRLEDTINYEELVEAVKTGMAGPAKLIEHAAYRIKRSEERRGGKEVVSTVRSQWWQ